MRGRAREKLVNRMAEVTGMPGVAAKRAIRYWSSSTASASLAAFVRRTCCGLVAIGSATTERRSQILLQGPVIDRHARHPRALAR